MSLLIEIFNIFDKIIGFLTMNWITVAITVIILLILGFLGVKKAMEFDERAYVFLGYFIIGITLFLILVMLSKKTEPLNLGFSLNNLSMIKNISLPWK